MQVNSYETELMYLYLIQFAFIIINYLKNKNKHYGTGNVVHLTSRFFPYLFILLKYSYNFTYQ